MPDHRPTRCYVDESVHVASGFVTTAFVFTTPSFEGAVATALRQAGLMPRRDEFKSSARMDSNPKMRAARANLINLAGSRARVAAFFGPWDRATIGKHSLQALQSTLVRNGIRPSHLSIYFDEGIFRNPHEARRLQELFSFLRPCRIYPAEDSRLRLGIQVADVVAHSFAQVLKEKLSGREKLVEIGGRGTGYRKGTRASVGWYLLTALRRALLTRPVIYNGSRYLAATDPVVLDPRSDDPVTYAQNPDLLGWGIQVAPEASPALRQSVEQGLGKIWLGCVH